jgi:hypothetical protein
MSAEPINLTFMVEIPNQTAAADPLRGQQSLSVRAVDVSLAGLQTLWSR